MRICGWVRNEDMYFCVYIINTLIACNNFKIISFKINDSDVVAIHSPHYVYRAVHTRL